MQQQMFTFLLTEDDPHGKRVRGNKQINNRNILFGIPLYSDYFDHDYVVQAKQAFNQTVLGFHNMARYGLHELRIVLHKRRTSDYPLWRNTFLRIYLVEHVAFMGLSL